jgi:hypothetical protein
VTLPQPSHERVKSFYLSKSFGKLFYLPWETLPNDQSKRENNEIIFFLEILS